MVDCFDALTSDRPYRPRLTDSEAIEILIERKGTLYDPLIVDTFVHVSTEITLDTPAFAVPNKLSRKLRTPCSRRQAWSHERNWRT